MGPLQREHVLRLLSASAFTRQLAGLKLLNDLVRCAVYVVQAVLHSFCWGRLPAILPTASGGLATSPTCLAFFS